MIAARDVYAAYRAWCEEHGHRCLSDTSFGKEVARRFPGVQRIRPGRRGTPRQWLYQGLRHQTEATVSGVS